MNHTLADWETLQEWEVKLRLALAGTQPTQDTCVTRDHDNGHMKIKDGPFPWDASVEGLLNSVINQGVLVGTLMTLFVYDIYNGRLVFAVALGFPGLISLVTPVMAELGGYHVTAINRFFTRLYSAILTPSSPLSSTSGFCPPSSTG